MIAFHWANDDLGIKPLGTLLFRTFQENYQFHTTSFTIPLQGSSTGALAKRLIKWSEQNSGDGHLRIFVYSGHASGTNATDWLLAGQTNQTTHQLQGPTVDWYVVRSLLETYGGDVCYIFHSCSAASAVLGQYDGGEFIAASGWGHWPTRQPEIAFSFTQVLIDTLNTLQGQPTSLASIFTKIFHEAQVNQISACPVHIPKQNKPSVTIGKNTHPGVLTPSMANSADKVLISIRIREDIPPDSNQWKDWLAHNLPPGITVEAAFGGSAILLLTLPMEVWTMMPRTNEAYLFIAHVTSNNLLRQTKQVSQTLIPSGPENMPFRLIEKRQ